MTTSGAGLFGNVGQANYGSAKGAIATLAGIVALEMERYGVAVNAISPIAATRMLATIGRSAAEGAGWDLSILVTLLLWSPGFVAPRRGG